MREGTEGCTCKLCVATLPLILNVTFGVRHVEFDAVMEHGPRKWERRVGEGQLLRLAATPHVAQLPGIRMHTLNE